MKLLMADIKGKNLSAELWYPRERNCGVRCKEACQTGGTDLRRNRLSYCSSFPFLEKLPLCHEVGRRRRTSIPRTGVGEPQSSSPTGERWNLTSVKRASPLDN